MFFANLHLAMNTENLRQSETENPTSLLPERIENRIRMVRGQKVILDSDLATLYGVKTKVLVQAVKRNIERFPKDFMFPLTYPELSILRSQIVTLRLEHGKHRKYLPFVFTEQGVAMLSSVLRSPRAILVNIEIMRTFVRLRQLLASHTDLAKKLDALERKYDSQFRVVFEAIRELMSPIEKPKRKIGF